MEGPNLLEQLLHCEKAVWDALVTGDAEADDRALSADFLGVYPDGFAGKSDHVAQLAAGPSVLRYALSAVRVLAFGPDHALLAYHATYVRTGRRDAEAMYVSSVWRRSDSGWVNVFSQDTPATGVRLP